MPLNLDKSISIRTGALVELVKTGTAVKILSLTLRLTERTILVEYSIVADDGSGRDHRSALIVPMDSISKAPIRNLLEDCYGELKKHPSLGAGTVTQDNI